jgi:cytochrome c oxidase subunit 2
MYRYQEHKRATFIPHNNQLEIAWTIVPAIVLTALVVTGWTVWSDITEPAPEDALAIEVMGKQFNWQIRYGGKDEKIGKFNYMRIDGTNSMGMDFEADESNYDDFMYQNYVYQKSSYFKIACDVLHSVFYLILGENGCTRNATQFWFSTKKRQMVKN